MQLDSMMLISMMVNMIRIKQKENIQNSMFGIDDGVSKWETVFNGINEKYPDVEQKVRENQKHARGSS